MELAIIGGGAAGMMAALTAAEWVDGTVTLLERQSRLGRKLLATGNGRCNLSNLTCAPSHYHGGYPDFVRPALDAFGVTDTLAFFRQRGLLTTSEPDGKCYPYSDQANSVLDTLASGAGRRRSRCADGLAGGGHSAGEIRWVHPDRLRRFSVGRSGHPHRRRRRRAPSWEAQSQATSLPRL